MNFNIDVGTIIIVLILGNLFSGILGVAYAAQKRNGFNITVYTFLLSRLFDTLGWVLLILRGVIGETFSIFIGTPLLIIGGTLQIIAFLTVKKCYTKPVKKAYIIFTTISIVIFNASVYFHSVESLKISIIAIILITIWSYPIYVLLTDKDSSILQKVIAIIYSLELILIFIRGYAAIKSGEEMSLFSDNFYNILFFIGLYILMLVGNFGLILIVKEKSDLDLEKAAAYDELTNILNRRTFLSHANESLALFSRRKEPVSLLLMDLDKFKKVNDVYGHFWGDMVLKDFASTIKGQLREYDLFCRFGGEEFIVLLPGEGEKEALQVAERLRKATEDSFVNVSEDSRIKYTVSIGVVTVIPNSKTSLDTLIKLSDDALYTAKNNGRNRVELAKYLK